MSKVRKGVITAAGRGTRQFPASAAVQKEMFTLVDRDGYTKPVIQIIAEELVASGIEEICIVTQPGDEKTYKEYFRGLSDVEAKVFKSKDNMLAQADNLRRLGQRLHFVAQHSPEGFGHAVYQARDFVGDEPCVLMLGDHIYISEIERRCTQQLIDVYEKHNCSAVTGVQLTLEKLLHLFGTIRGKPIDEAKGIYGAELIVEKPSVDLAREKMATPGLPAGNYLAHFGIHVFSPAIFDSLEYLIKNDLREKNEIQLTAAQEHLRQNSEKYWTVVVQGQRYDTGIPAGLVETQLALALNSVYRREICEAIARILAMQVRS